MSLGYAQEANAQKWLKALGKVAGAVLGDESSSSSSSSSSSISSNDKSKSSSSATANKVKVTLTEAVRYGAKGVRIEYVLENTNSDNVLVVLKATTAKFSGMNAIYPTGSYINNSGFEQPVGTSFEEDIKYDSHYIPAGAKAKGYFYFAEVGTNAKNLESLSFKAIYYPKYIVPDFGGTIITKNLGGMPIED